MAAAPARPSACATLRPDRTMLSPITMTVTVAPETMSTGGLDDDWLASCGYALADIAGDEPVDALRRNADQDDRFVMIDQLGPGDAGIGTKPDQHVDRTPGISRSC